MAAIDEPSAEVRADAPPRFRAVAASSMPIADRLLVLACIAATVFFALDVLLFEYGRDQGIYAMVARAILHGGMPYRDAWDFKPPGVYLIYALARALFGSSEMGIRALEVAGLGVMVAGIVALSRSWWGDARVGWVAAALTVTVHAQLEFWHTAQPESFGGVLTVLALWLTTAARDAPPRKTAAAWAAAGALLGFSGLLKPPLIGAAAVLGAAHVIEVWREAEGNGRLDRALASIRASAPRLAALIAGAALPIALCLVWFAAKGALRDLVQVLFVFTPHYTALSWAGASVVGMIYYGFLDWLTTYSSALTVGLLLLLGFRPNRAERPGVFLLLGIVGLHLVGIILQGKFFPYHYGATWPLTAMLAALGVVKLWDAARARGAIVAAAAVAAFAAAAFAQSATRDTRDTFLDRVAARLAAYTATPRDRTTLDRLASVADVNAGANRAVAEFVRAHVPEGRAIFVWGFEPVIYDLADRAPASRFLYDVPQRVAWAKEPMRAQLVADLDRTRPAAIVVEHRDVFPAVTGTTIDSADELPAFPELSRLLGTYRLATSIEDFDVYLESQEPRASTR